jgi:prolyl-tRNA synthetase
MIRYSRYSIRTRKEIPRVAELISHQLLLRAGFIHQIAAGIFDYNPIAVRVIRKIENIIRTEMDAIEGQEVIMPILNPAELWIESQRYESVGHELIRFKDRKNADFVLAMTNEETVTDLARSFVKSYRDLPFMFYQIRTKIRDEARPRGGVMRVREFSMKDAYSFHQDVEDLDEYYKKVYNAYLRIFHRCGIKPNPVEADTGSMGGKASHEFILKSNDGEDTFVTCPHCSYSANVEAAPVLVDGQPKPVPAGVGALEKVATPNVKTIEDLTKFFGIGESQFLKTVAYQAEGKIVIVVVNGAYEVNETKLKNHLKVSEIDLADPAILAEKGMAPGFLSPVGFNRQTATMLFDRTVQKESVYIAGANEIDVHYKNVVLGRDVTLDTLYDLAEIRAGDLCPKCHEGRAEIAKGVELGHTFKLGTRYSTAMKLESLGKDGKNRPVIMGCYGIGVERLMASVIQNHNDADGIIWPLAVAPFEVDLVSLAAQAPSVVAIADDLANSLAREFDLLYDDRDEKPGVKFKDADLLGIPIRIVVSQKNLDKNQIEIKVRRTKEVFFVEPAKVLETLRDIKAKLTAQEVIPTVELI